MAKAGKGTGTVFFKIGNSWYQFSDAQAANIGKKSKRNATDLVIFLGVCNAQPFETCDPRYGAATWRIIPDSK